MDVLRVFYNLFYCFRGRSLCDVIVFRRKFIVFLSVKALLLCPETMLFAV